MIKRGSDGIEIELNISHDGDWKGTVSAPEWGDFEWPLLSVAATEADTFIAQIGAPGCRRGVLKGQIEDGGIVGTYTWGDTEYRVQPPPKPAGSAPPKRHAAKQVPLPPYPYETRSVTFDSSGTRISGALTIPTRPGPHPAVVLLRGSGAHTWDAGVPGDPEPNIFAWVLADGLSRAGIATLRMDSRGTGGSSGDYDGSSFETLTADAISAVEYLELQKDIAAGRVGLLGHSQGAGIAAAASAKSSKIAFVVHLSGWGVPTDEMFLQQIRSLRIAAHFDKNPNYPLEPIIAMERHISDLAKSDKSPNQIYREMYKWYDDQEVKPVPREKLDDRIAHAMTPLIRSELRFNPAEALRQLNVPFLDLHGEKDLWCSAEQNIPAIRAALKAGGDRDVTIECFPGLDHFLTESRTGFSSNSDYSIKPEVLSLIVRWTSKQAGTEK